jgi:TolA-binding protein
MNRKGIFIAALCIILAACQTTGGGDTIARLRNQHIEIKEEKVEGGLEKAMQGYQNFLDKAPDSALKAEAIRRLADLKIAKEYGTLASTSAPVVHAPALSAPIKGGTEKVVVPVISQSRKDRVSGESQDDFENRAAKSDSISVATGTANIELPGSENLERAGAREAIVLYQKLIHDYPDYERNDQVLYQMSRAYEELGQVDDAMKVMNRLVQDYPKSHYMDEVQFRRAEYLFTRRHYMDAETAYASVVQVGTKSYFYQLALYKLGWTYYKQDLYEEALDRYIALLDYKVSVGYDFTQTKDEQEKKRIDDTFRAVSLCFSNLGGAKSVSEYFASHGKRSYEDGVYSNLGEFYFDKQRYADAAAVYNAFVNQNPFHKVAPQFAMRVIDIDVAGAFPSLVIDAKKQFSKNYGLRSEYWKHFEPAARPEVLGWLKTNLTDLAKYYHSLYQNPVENNEKGKEKEKGANYEEALHWYREFLITFPKDTEAPAMNYLMADLYLENHAFDLAAGEYEKTSYSYPRHDKSAQAGYAAVYAYRQYLAVVPAESKEQVTRVVVKSSLQFADTYPEHEKAAIVLCAASDDLYNLHDYEPAVAAARKLIEKYPGAGVETLRSAWLVVGHGTYELHRYSEAETAYATAIPMFPAGDKNASALTDNLAAAIYKQGEQANAGKDYKTASEHFLRVGRIAPASKIRANAEYDAAAALIALKDWKTAATVLLGFRNIFPKHELQPEVTKKIAFVYREDGKLALSAAEYERMETESGDDELRREALLTAAELYEKAENTSQAVVVYQRYINYFPHPSEANIETRSKLAEALKKREHDTYMAELKKIVSVEAAAGTERTPRTRYIAGNAALVLTEETYSQFIKVRLVEPFEANLDKKKGLMKVTTQEFTKLLDYEVSEITAAATYYLAEIYTDFNKSLKESERPKDLSAAELEEYEIALEDQAYPFEEKAIEAHKRNLELISRGVYNAWIEKSLHKLAESVPARYDKPEETSEIISSLETFIFEIERPAMLATPQSEPTGPVQAGTPGSVTGPEVAEPARDEKPGPVTESLSEKPAKGDSTALTPIRTDQAIRR